MPRRQENQNNTPKSCARFSVMHSMPKCFVWRTMTLCQLSMKRSWLLSHPPLETGTHRITERFVFNLFFYVEFNILVGGFNFLISIWNPGGFIGCCESIKIWCETWNFTFHKFIYFPQEFAQDLYQMRQQETDESQTRGRWVEYSFVDTIIQVLLVFTTTEIDNIYWDYGVWVFTVWWCTRTEKEDDDSSFLTHKWALSILDVNMKTLFLSLSFEISTPKWLLGILDGVQTIVLVVSFRFDYISIEWGIRTILLLSHIVFLV